MTKRRIAILGGGIGGLTTAYYLSRTAELRDRFQVTVYQMGWRLGGKIASGRDRLGRNLEHGLHVWFGCYENAFQLLQEIYGARTPPPESPFKTWRDVVKAQDLTPIGTKTATGWTFVPVEWPDNCDVPGDGKLFPTPWAMVTQLYNLIAIIMKRLSDSGFPMAVAPLPDLAPLLTALHGAVDPSLAPSQAARTVAASVEPAPVDVAVALHGWASALGADPLRSGVDHLATLVMMTRAMGADFGARSADPSLSPTIRMMLEAVDVFRAAVQGIANDLLFPDRPLIALDDIELHQWLLGHGADARVVAESSVVRMLYDTAFLYQDGDPARPSVGAGCALGAGLRLITTYKGSMMWELQGGMGECVIAPLYEALLGAEVEFRFFHKVASIDPAPGQNAIAAVQIDRQAVTLAGDYNPTFEVNGLTCWRAEPDWTQLQNGQALQARGVNFESHWCAEPPVDRVTLVRGQDFDDVVLAIPLGAYKPLNQDPGMCDALIARGGRFADFVNKLAIVPTIGVQLWTNVDNAHLGWTQPKPATVAGPQPLCVWADMSQVLDVESTAGVRPLGLHYLCGTYPTTLYAQPISAVDTPTKAMAEVRAMTIEWLQQEAGSSWPLASNGRDFQWDMLSAPPGVAGESRLDAQYIRVNIDPTECTVGSDVGTSKYRLGPTDAGFDGLYLAGESTLQGFNATAVEAALMSGMAAAKAIGDLPINIVGYDFPTRKPSDFLR
jgi:uncharacterized protein with NAD-binding domain and iron-sulfur cluster